MTRDSCRPAFPAPHVLGHGSLGTPPTAPSPDISSLLHRQDTAPRWFPAHQHLQEGVAKSKSETDAPGQHERHSGHHHPLMSKLGDPITCFL